MANLLFNQFDGNSYSSYYGDINPSINKELNFNGNRLTNVGEPINDNDAITKLYLSKTIKKTEVHTFNNVKTDYINYGDSDVLALSDPLSLDMDYMFCVVSLHLYIYQQTAQTNSGITLTFNLLGNSITAPKSGGTSTGKIDFILFNNKITYMTWSNGDMKTTTSLGYCAINLAKGNQGSNFTAKAYGTYYYIAI